MKIAVIRQKYVNYGGAESFVANYAEAMAEEGHEIHIFANKWTASKHSNIHIHPVPAIKINSFIRSLSFAWFAGRAVRRGSFDIVQSHERIFSQDVFRAGDGCHKQWLELRNKNLSPLKQLTLALSPFHWLILRLEKSIFETSACKKVIAISEMVKKDIQRHYRIPDKKIVVIYNGVSLQRFHPDKKKSQGQAVRRTLGVRPEETLILHVGSGFERKGTATLLRALEELPNLPWRLALLGKADWVQKLQDLPQAIQKKIIPLAPVDDVENYYASADLFVLPSIYEPFGNAVLEALATGLPVIVSRTCGSAEILTPDEEGMVLEDPEDFHQLADKISRLFDANLREIMGRKARTLAEQFTGKRNAQKMLEVYKTILEEKKGDTNTPG
jgi:UDP-glucose:(heptosyl)LPS alpha-1,3-glucosyltransferase